MVETKIISVPEMGYFITDKPFPRGELLIKGSHNISGYYRNEEANKEYFDEENWFKTGDIVEEISKSKIKIIDRKKHIFKLSSGLFVSPFQLESIYITSSKIGQIYIHGESTESVVIAIVVPIHIGDHNNDNNNNNNDKNNNDNNNGLSKSYLSEDKGRNYQPTIEENDFKLAKEISKEFRLIAQENKLRSHEIPAGIFIDHDPFTCANKRLTNNNKPNRNECSKYYSIVIRQLYEIINHIKNTPNNNYNDNNYNYNDNNNNNNTNNNNDDNERKNSLFNQSNWKDKIGMILGTDLENYDENEPIKFDSLTAVQFHSIMKEEEKNLPIDLLLHGLSLREISQLIPQNNTNNNLNNDQEKNYRKLLTEKINEDYSLFLSDLKSIKQEISQYQSTSQSSSSSNNNNNNNNNNNEEKENLIGDFVDFSSLNKVTKCEITFIINRDRSHISLWSICTLEFDI